MIEFLGISLVIILAAISPGPDFILVSRNALQYSQKHGILTGLGIAIGTLFHATYCILGFALVISKSILIFNMIKYLGAGYLIYLGIKGLFEKNTSLKVDPQNKEKRLISSWQAFQQGIICNVMNPKAVLFFLALFTVMIKPSMPFIIQSAYAIEIALVEFIWFSLVSILFSHHKIKLFLGKFLHYITRTFGGILIAFGIKIATLSHS